MGDGKMSSSEQHGSLNVLPNFVYQKIVCGFGVNAKW
jgi:hypothetical protein